MIYTPSLEMVTVQQLLITRNRCSFRRLIPSRPGKFGIKIFWLVDAETNYPLSADMGLQSDQNGSTIAKDLVFRLMKEFFKLGANLTMDKSLVDLHLAGELIAKNTTMTGLIRANKQELPKIFKSAEEAIKRGQNKAIFYYSKSCELVSYTSNTNENVLLLSTAHATDEINTESGKPLAIHDYDEQKVDGDLFDKALRSYTCKRKSNRWPMLLFYNMIDVAALAALRLYELSHPLWNVNKRDKRRIFLKELAHDLAKNQLETRCKKPLKYSTKTAMDLIGFKPNVALKRKLPNVQVSVKIFRLLSL